MEFKIFELTVAKYLSIKGIGDFSVNKNHYKQSFDKLNNHFKDNDIIVIGVEGENKLMNVGLDKNNFPFSDKEAVKTLINDDDIKDCKHKFILINDKIYINNLWENNRITEEFINNVKSKIKKYSKAS